MMLYCLLQLRELQLQLQLQQQVRQLPVANNRLLVKADLLTRTHYLSETLAIATSEINLGVRNV